MKKRIYFYLSMGFLLIVIAGFRNIGYDRDSINYVRYIHSDMNYIDVEPAFLFIKWINSVIFSSNDQTFFLIFAIIGVSLKLIAIYRISISPLFALVGYIAMYFILHEMTQIRVGVSSAFFLLAISDIYTRNIKLYSIKITFAVLFHYSAIILLFFYALNPRKINILLYSIIPVIGLIICISGVNIPNILSDNLFFLPEIISNKLSTYIYILVEYNQYNEFKLYTFYHASLLIFYYVILYNSKYFKSKYQIICIKLFSFMLLANFGMSSFPVLAGRVSQLIGVVLIILLSDFIFSFKQKLIPLILMIIWLTLYFNIQLNILGN